MAAFAASASVLKASRSAQIDRSRHYQWLEEDPVYAEKFIEAEKRALRTLEDEMIRRGHEGLRKAVWYKGRVVGYETEYSDRMLELAIKGNGRQKYRDRERDDPPVPIANNLTLIIQMIMQELDDAPQEIRQRLGQRLMRLGATQPTD